MFALVLAPTADVVTVKIACGSPSGTSTVDCTPARLLSLESVTSAPPAGAGAPRVTVPLRLVPPSTSDAESVSDASTPDAGAIASDAFLLPRYVAVIVAF